MKAKVKFDSAQLKTFLLHHVEKLVFGGFVVAFLLLCWSAFKLKPYDKTPDQLKATADRVSQEVDKATPPEKFADLPSVPDFSNLGAVGPAAVDPRMYKIDPLSRPYEDRQDLRKEPKFFGLEDALAFAGYGAIAINEKEVVDRLASSGIGGGMGMTPEMPMPGMMGYGGGGGMPSNYGMMDTGEMMKRMAESQQQQQQQQQQMAGYGMMGPGMGQGMMGQGGRRARRPPKRTAKKEAPKVAAPRPKPQVTEKITLSSTPAGSKLEGRYWVCLTGAIPFRKQFLEYQATFRDARGYDTKSDYPQYDLPHIERAEVIGDKTGEWQSLDLEEAIQDLRKWGVAYPEIADKQFLDPDLTEPLPPLIFANHDKDKVNHPRTQLAEEKLKPVVAEGSKKKKISLSGARRLDDPQAAYNRSRSMGAGMTGAYSAAGGIAARIPEYRLFRFFDFTVEPGKTYRYRVKLTFKNPNADVQRRYLENYASAEGATREADWSKPSERITVIAGNRLLAANVSAGPAGRGEPSGSVLAKLFDDEQAVEVRKIFDVHRGSVLNQRDMEIGVPDPSSSGTQAATVDFETGAVVLDMFGGERLPGAKSSGTGAAPKVPGHFLVLDNDGAFKTLTQSSDAAMYETEAEEAKKQAPPKEGERKPGAAAADGNNGFFKDFNQIDSPPRKPRKR